MAEEVLSRLYLELSQVIPSGTKTERELALERALAPFSDVDGEGDEDFNDNTPVVVTFGRTTHYTLTLGDFRRARAALS